MTTPIEKSNLPASWQNTDGYNRYYWNVSGVYLALPFVSEEMPKYKCFEFTLVRACDQPYSIVKGYTFTWRRIDQDILVNFPFKG